MNARHLPWVLFEKSVQHMSSIGFLCEKITSKHILSVEGFGDEDRFCLKLFKRYTKRRTVRFGCRVNNYDKIMKNVENYRSKMRFITMDY